MPPVQSLRNSSTIDTVRVRLSGGVRTVRLACIDAPELVQSPWGQQARQQLQALAPIGSAVELRSTATDRYSRLETGQRYRCSEIGSHAMAQQPLAQGHRTLDGDGDGEACEGLGGSSS